MIVTVHWIEAEDERGLPVWHRYLALGPWGLHCTHVLPRWIIPTLWEAGIARVGLA